jgi:hypothetical protein
MKVTMILIVLMFLAIPQVHAGPIEIVSGVMDGSPWPNDFAFSILGNNGIKVGGYESFGESIVTGLSTGHISERILVNILRDTDFPFAYDSVFMNFELSFMPILMGSPWDPAAPGQAGVTQPFTMTSILYGGPSNQTLDFVGHGMITAKYLAYDSGFFPGPYVIAHFQTPEASSLALLGVGLIGLLMSRKSMRRLLPQRH